MFFFFIDTAPTRIYTYGHTLSLHDALPICQRRRFFQRAALDGHVFADRVAVTDLHARRIVRPGAHVLRDLAERGELEDLVVATDRHRPAQHHVRSDPGAGTNRHAGTDDAVWPALDGLVQFVAAVQDRPPLNAPPRAHAPLS